MQTIEAKNTINNILNSKVKFEGHFDKCFINLKNTQQDELIEWIKACKELKINPIQSKSNREIIGFVKRIGSNIRVILTKERIFY